MEDNRLDMRCHEYMVNGYDATNDSMTKLYCHKPAGHRGNHKSKSADGDIEWNFDDN